MRNLKKILALVLALMMVLSVMVTSSAAFEDADEIQHTEAVEVMSNLGILLGDGTNFNPNGTLTRAQAAVIIAKVMEGSVDNIAVLVDAVENPFTDVPAWALDYVLYAYSKGVVIGTSADKYTPNKNLTGYEFGKMLLVAAGICDSEDFTASTNWKITVSENLTKTGLLYGLTDLVLSKDLSREHAAQMAFNAMNYATSTNYGYAVMNKGDDTVKGTADDYLMGYYPSMVEAATAAAVLDNCYYNTTKSVYGNDSLAASVFGLNTVYSQEDIGYEGYYWYVNKDNVAGYNYQKDVLVSGFICTDTVVGTFTKANSWKEVAAALGKTADFTATTYANGVAGANWTIDFDTTAKCGSDSDVTLTVAVAADETIKLMYAREYLTIAVRGAKVTDKTSPYYGLYTWSFNNETALGAPVSVVYAAADAYVNNAAYLVVPTYIPTITPAQSVVGKIVGMATGSYIRLDNNNVYYLSDTGVSASVDNTTYKTVYLNSAGQVIYVGGVGAAAATVYDGYNYVVALQYVATPYVPTGLVGSGSEATISAKAIVVTPAGETSLVDVATRIYNPNAYTFTPQYWLNGQWNNATADNTTKTVTGGAWMAYTAEEGAYKFDTMTTSTITGVTAKKADVTVAGTACYMDAKTVITFVDYNVDSEAIETVSITGYTNITALVAAALADAEAVVVADPVTKVVSSITVYGTTTTTGSVDFAVYYGLLETNANPALNAYGFIVNGELKPYYIADASVVSGLSAGDIVTFDTDVDGVVTAATEVSAAGLTVDENLAVTAIAADGSYFIVGSTVYYLAPGYVVYDTALNGYAPAELGVGQTVKAISYNGSVLAIFITAHPAD